jgi:DNA-binding response OmpR family regulator
VVRAIREQMETKVIYVTAHPEAIRASGNSDRDTVITKPFQVREIERAVKAHLAA